MLTDPWDANRKSIAPRRQYLIRGGLFKSITGHSRDNLHCPVAGIVVHQVIVDAEKQLIATFFEGQLGSQLLANVERRTIADPRDEREPRAASFGTKRW
jgi:hypothetical protein